MSYLHRFILLCLLAASGLCLVKDVSSVDKSSSDVQCGCLPTCPLLSNNATNFSSDGYFFDRSSGTCMILSEGCGLASECLFESLEVCKSRCKQDGHRCESSQNGCCPDKVTTRKDDGSCGSVHPASVGAKDSHKEVISPGSSKKVSGVRWDVVAIGAGVIVLLIIVLGLSGVITYMYRHSHKDKQRSRYIHQVLQMYEEETDSSSSSSECSVDDNPETNNLFERL